MVKYQEGSNPEKDTVVTRDSCEYPGGRDKDNGEQVGKGAHGDGEDGVCWERVGGRWVGGT